MRALTTQKKYRFIWCQIVLDLLDLTFAKEGTLRNSDSQWIITITK